MSVMTYIHMEFSERLDIEFNYLHSLSTLTYMVFIASLQFYHCVVVPPRTVSIRDVSERRVGGSDDDTAPKFTRCGAETKARASKCDKAYSVNEQH